MQRPDQAFKTTILKFSAIICGLTADANTIFPVLKLVATVINTSKYLVYSSYNTIYENKTDLKHELTLSVLALIQLASHALIVFIHICMYIYICNYVYYDLTL